MSVLRHLELTQLGWQKTAQRPDEQKRYGREMNATSYAGLWLNYVFHTQGDCYECVLKWNKNKIGNHLAQADVFSLHGDAALTRHQQEAHPYPSPSGFSSARLFPSEVPAQSLAMPNQLLEHLLEQ